MTIVIGKMLASTKKIDLLWFAEKHFEIVSFALSFYEKTKDKDFYDFAVWFNNRAKELKNKANI